MTRIAKFCTHCGEPLAKLQRDGRLRPYCHACEMLVYFDPKVAVVVFIQRGERVLLIQRAIDPGRGKWALPAGFVDHDESPEAAAIRETMEETQLEVNIEKLLAVYPKRDEGLADIVIAYSASEIGGTATAGDDAADLGWFDRDNIPPLVFYPSITLINLWREGKLDI